MQKYYRRKVVTDITTDEEDNFEDNFSFPTKMAGELEIN